jgi:hypothetical protein
MTDSSYVVEKVKLIGFGKLGFCLQKGSHIHEFILDHDALKFFSRKIGHCDEETLKELFNLNRDQFIYAAFRAIRNGHNEFPIQITKAMLESADA